MNFRIVFYSKSGLRIGWNILLYFVITLLTVALFVAPIVFILSLLDLSPQIGKPVDDWKSIIGAIITLLFGYFGFLSGNYLSQQWLNSSDLVSLGLRLNKSSFKLLFLGIGFGSVIIFVSALLSLLFGWYTFSGFAWQYRPPDLLFAAFILLLVVKIQPALIEETIFRGYLLKLFADRYTLRTAVIVTSVLFGFAHLSSIEDYPWWATILSTIIAGFLFAQAFVLSKNLYLPIGIHYGWHIFGRLINDTGEPIEKSMFLVSNVHGPTLLTPTSGGGASLFELIGVGIVSIVMWKMSRSNSMRWAGGSHGSDPKVPSEKTPSEDK